MEVTAKEFSKNFQINIRRCSLLAPFIFEWGEPTACHVFTREENEVEIYYFPDTATQPFCHFVTFGAAWGTRGGVQVRHELYFTINEDLEDAGDENAGCSWDQEIAFLLMNIVEHSYREDVLFAAHRTIPPMSGALEGWANTAILIDHPVNVPFVRLRTEGDEIEIYQIFLIHETEYESIRNEGLPSFYKERDRLIVENVGMLFDPNRASFFKKH